MPNSYQATYDAVRSRISNGNIGAAVESAIRDANIGFFVQQAVDIATQDIAIAMTRPSVLYRPHLAIDGNKWSALYGDNIQQGVCGFGDSPAEAMADFDAEWAKALAKPAAPVKAVPPPRCSDCHAPCDACACPF